MKDMINDHPQLMLSDAIVNHNQQKNTPSLSFVHVSTLETINLHQTKSVPIESIEENRKFYRQKAEGELSQIKTFNPEIECSLNDYSGGGVCFSSNQVFYIGNSLNMLVKDPLDDDSHYLDFDIQVVRIGQEGQKFIVGCQISNELDLEIWQSLI